MSYIVAMDTTGIQSYIFNSNKLPEIIGASYLVKQAAVKAKKIVTSDQLIYANGGNCVAQFETESDAQAFIKELSKWVYEKAPGVELIFGICTDDLLPLKQRVDNAFKDIDKKKNTRISSQSLLGLSVTKACYATGLPASYLDEERYINSSIKAKLNTKDQANKSLSSCLSKGSNDGLSYKFPLDLDQLGRSKGDTSLIAVVHIDGNGIGERLKSLNHEKEEDHKDLIREFSDTLEGINKQALYKTIQDLINSIEITNNRPCIVNKNSNVTPIRMSQDEDKDKIILPFRPIIFGGDDVTFVCDGRIGISLAIRYMEYLKIYSQKTPLPDEKGIITASAGIAIIKPHYPFARAYQLADALCSNAKKYRKELGDESGNFLDWHIAYTVVNDSLKDLRKKDYQEEYTNERRSKSLTQRPVRIRKEGSTEQERTWDIIEEALYQFQSGYADRRNKVKELRDALRLGEVESFVARHSPLPALSINAEDDFQNTGFLIKSIEGNPSTQCVYYDAVELLDLWIPIDSSTKG
ncbi:MAG TPA: hypothetical protein PLO56_03345 [Rhodothermales bacterium]|nr:hypothetical protein [Rhodothermales bacterium]